MNRKWLAMTCLLSACTEQPTMQSWEGEAVTIVSGGALTPCGGTSDFLDRYAGHVHRYWTGEDLPVQFTAELELRDDSAGGDWGGAYAGSGHAWVAHEAALLHELNHLIVGGVDGASAVSLTEGVAEAIAPGDLAEMYSPTVPVAPETFAFKEADDFTRADYPPAAQVVRFLMQRHGVASVREAYRTARRNDTSETIEDVFLRVWGESIYVDFDDYLAADQCALQAWECDGNVLPVVTLPFRVDSPGDCSDDAKLLGWQTREDDGAWFPESRFILELSETTSVRIDVTENGVLDRMTCLESCLGLPEDATGNYNKHPVTGETVLDITLDAGRHTFRARPADPTRPFTIELGIAQ